MSDTVTATLLELLSKLFGGDEELRNEFLDNPDAFVEKYELEDLSCSDFNDAVLAFVDSNIEDNDYNLGGKFYADKDEHHGDDTEAVKTVIKKIVEEGDTYNVTHNYDNDTVYDASFKGTVIADGDVEFDNDITTASGDGAVAAGRDIDGDVTSGDNNFNQGTIVGGDQTADDGSAISGGLQSGAAGNQQDFIEDNDTVNDNDIVTDVDTTEITSTDVDQETNNENVGNTTTDSNNATETNTEVNTQFDEV